MKVILYEREKMLRAGNLINSISVSGSSNFRALAELSDILDSGIPAEYEDKKEGEDDGVGSKEVCKN